MGRKYFSSPKNHIIKADLLGDLTDILPAQQFDMVTCFETIEHITSENDFLNKINRLLKPGGILLISSPNEEIIPCLQNPFYPGGKNPHHHRHYTPKELKELLSSTGFTVIDQYTQCPNNMVRGENGFVIVYVCTNMSKEIIKPMNSVEKAIEKLNVVQMRKLFPFLENKASSSIEITSLDRRIDEILNSYHLLITANTLLENQQFKESLDILLTIDKSLCPESYLFLGIIYQAQGTLFRAIEMYSKILDNSNRVSSIISTLAEEQLVNIINKLQ
ncbi:class I SAM-dependent methyltransferase [Paenibacillus sp. P25]|nr:class I SAM-dependent methyltransferase [Paenibacillus sp. P25]